MKGILHRLALIPKSFRDALLAPAQDPRQVYGIVYQWQGAPVPETLQLDHIRQNLERGFSQVGSDAGLGALRELEHEHAQLLPLLNRRKATDPLSIARIPALAEETYRQGLSILEDALELARTVHATDVSRLEETVAQLERDTEAMDGDETQAQRLRMRQESLATQRELLQMITRQRLRVDELLHQSHRCQTSLQRTRIELATLRADRSGANVDAVTETLSRTINQAKEVQDEMKRLGL